jgi:alkylation response protein AidB-like acyl-CoA dehydrogenase
LELSLNETQTFVQKTARDYATQAILPLAESIDRHESIPGELLRGLADRGLMAVNVSEEVGGAGRGAVSYALAIEEIARACASTAVTMAVTNMVGEVVAAFGTAEQRQRVCKKLASGEWAAGSFALSEPEAGSDPGGMRTVATRENGRYTLRGHKQWITNAAFAGVFVVWARTAPRETHPGARGVSCFLVEGQTPGLRVGRAEDKMGIRGSNTAAIELDDCRVPESALLGDPEGGFKIAMMALDGGRIGISAQAVGIARAALDESVAYASDRRQLDGPIAERQAIRQKLADMKTDLDASSLLYLRAAWLKENRRAFSREASMAKVFATEAAHRICTRAVQIHGEYGVTRDFAVERHLRDIRVTTIYEGTSEIQRMVIARSLLTAY